MSFGVAPIVAIFLFFTGCACAQLVCLLIAKCCRRSDVGARISAICVWFSFAIALYTVLIFLYQNIGWIVALWQDSASVHRAILFLWALAGFFVGIRWKIFLPLCLLCYLLITAVVGFFLYDAFGKQYREYTVVVQESSIKINDSTISRHAAPHAAFVFSVWEVPHAMMLPLPRHWYTLSGFYEGTLALPADAEYTAQSLWQSKGVVQRMTEKYPPIARAFSVMHMLFPYDADRSLQYIPLPHDTALPALYTLRVSVQGAEFAYTLKKDL